jgi:hypothetical protein
MSDTERKGSRAPMWWGIFLVLAFTVAATIDYNRSDPVNASVMARTDTVR